MSDDVRLILGDCLEILPTLDRDSIAAVVSDPPYGMRYVGSPGTSHRTGIHSNGHGRRTRETVKGDDRPFDPAPWLAWPCALFGPQHYYEKLPPGGSFHSWDKRGDYKRTTFADADFVWINRRRNAQTFRLVWRGLCRHAENRHRIEHPTQKPVELMKWVIGLLDLPPGSTILDPYMGSGSTGVAAVQLGHRFIGCEVDPAHFETARRRIASARAATPLLSGAVPP